MSVPDIRIKTLDVDGPTTPGTPVPVSVKVNNAELLPPYGGDAACSTDGNGTANGHRTEVSIEVRSALGSVVTSETKTICAPNDVGSNEPVVEFSPTVDSAGSYTVRAEVQVPTFDAPSDTAAPVGFEAVENVADLPDETGESPGSGDSGGILPPRFRGDGSNNSSGLNLGLGFGSVDVVLGLVALLAIAWLADSAADIAP